LVQAFQEFLNVAMALFRCLLRKLVAAVAEGVLNSLQSKYFEETAYLPKVPNFTSQMAGWGRVRGAFMRSARSTGRRSMLRPDI